MDIRPDHPCLGCSNFDENPDGHYAICRWMPVGYPVFACFGTLAQWHPEKSDTWSAARFVNKTMPLHKAGEPFPACPQRC